MLHTYPGWFHWTEPVVQSSPHFEVPTSFRLVLIFNQPRWGSKNCNTSSNGIFQIKCSVCLPPKCKRLVMFTLFFVSSDEPELLMFCPSSLCHVLSHPNSATCAAHLSICGRIPHQIWHQGKSNGSPSSLLVHHLPVNKPSDARHRYKLPTAFYTASVISLYELQIWRRSDDLYVKRSVTGRPSYKKHPKYNGLSPSLCTICFSAASPDGPS